LRRSPKPGRLDRSYFEPTAQLVDDERGQRLAFDVFSDDQQRLRRLGNRLEQRQQRLEARQLLLVKQDVGLVQLGQHLLRVGHEIGADIAAVELHALDDVELSLKRFCLFDRDYALIADLLHRFGDHPTDLVVIIGRDRADLGDLVIGRHLLRALFNLLHHHVDCPVDATLQIHRVHACSRRPGALVHDRRGEDGGSRRAVASGIARLRGHLAHHLRAHVLEFVGELDLLSDSHPVLADARGTKGFVEHDVAAFRT